MGKISKKYKNNQDSKDKDMASLLLVKQGKTKIK